MEHIVKFTKGFDCVRFECVHNSDRCKPGSRGSHGVHGLDICFISKGPEGAVEFVIYTGWLPQYFDRQKSGNIISNWGSDVFPAFLCYHSKQPRYEGQNQSTDNCDYCDGALCYNDGSALNARDAMYTLVNGGGDAIVRFMDGYYNFVFHDGPYPELEEFEKPLRKTN